MTATLTDLLSAGLIQDLAGDDERFAKFERATEKITKEFGSQPTLLIDGILAGLDPDVPATDPAMVFAEQALVSEWKTMRSVYPSAPIGILRAILLAAVFEARDGNGPAIVWLTAADMLPLLHPGNEGEVIRRMLTTMAVTTETLALASAPDTAKAAITTEVTLNPAPAPTVVDRARLLLQIAAMAGPNYRNDANGPLDEPNQYWTNSAGNWSWEFADRMHKLLADRLDGLAMGLGEQHRILLDELSNTLTSQRTWIRNALEHHQTRSRAEELRLNVLWWSEAMYSTTLQRSYRDLPPPLAAVVMAVDLLDQVPKLAPASVAHLLAEVVHRLPGAAHDHRYELRRLLLELHAARDHLPDEWSKHRQPRAKGRLSLRDLVFGAIAAPTGTSEALIADSTQQAGLAADVALSLPSLARAVFRQDQAVRLARSAT